jgi:hypothetical protein
MSQVAEVLHAAANQIETYGWLQGNFYDAGEGDPSKCSACALGAIEAQAGGEGDTEWAAPLALLRFLGLTPSRSSITQWNDYPDQTAENVIATLRKAADLEEQGE